MRSSPFEAQVELRGFVIKRGQIVTALIAGIALAGCGASSSGGAGDSSSAESDFTLSIAAQISRQNCSICHEFAKHDVAHCGDAVWEDEHKDIILCPEIVIPDDTASDPALDGSSSDPSSSPSSGSGSGGTSKPKKPKSGPPAGLNCTMCHADLGAPKCSDESWQAINPVHRQACPKPPKKKKGAKSLSSWNTVKDLALFLNGDDRI